MAPAKAAAHGAVGALLIARPAIGKEGRVSMVASRLGHHVPGAQVNPALAVGAAILRTAVTVGAPPARCLLAAPPVSVSADLAPVLFCTNLNVILGLEVLDGLQRAPGGQWSNEGDFDHRS